MKKYQKILAVVISGLIAITIGVIIGSELAINLQRQAIIEKLEQTEVESCFFKTGGSFLSKDGNALMVIRSSKRGRKTLPEKMARKWIVQMVVEPENKMQNWILFWDNPDLEKLLREGKEKKQDNLPIRLMKNARPYFYPAEWLFWQLPKLEIQEWLDKEKSIEIE